MGEDGREGEGGSGQSPRGFQPETKPAGSAELYPRMKEGATQTAQTVPRGREGAPMGLGEEREKVLLVSA